MDAEVEQKLRFLAEKYEVSSFRESDPSQFLIWYPREQVLDIECASFIAAMLAFGNRKQFIPKIREILTLADNESGSVSKWLLANHPSFLTGVKKFYRFYSYDDFCVFFSELKFLIENALNKGDNSLGEYFHSLFLGYRGDSPAFFWIEIMNNFFKSSKIVPKGKNSANKRVNMFLRWMVRQNSSVDLGLWSWFPMQFLTIPLDVHVMEEAKKLNLLSENDKATYKTARKLTNQLNIVFPGDPCKGDFALFGLGVDN